MFDDSAFRLKPLLTLAFFVVGGGGNSSTIAGTLFLFLLFETEEHASGFFVNNVVSDNRVGLFAVLEYVFGRSEGSKTCFLR